MGGSTSYRFCTCWRRRRKLKSITMSDIDKLSRKVPMVCVRWRRAQSTMEDVHRAGGVLGILASWTAPGC